MKEKMKDMRWKKTLKVWWKEDERCEMEGERPHENKQSYDAWSRVPDFADCNNTGSWAFLNAWLVELLYINKYIVTLTPPSLSEINRY